MNQIHADYTYAFLIATAKMNNNALGVPNFAQITAKNEADYKCTKCTHTAIARDCIHGRVTNAAPTRLLFVATLCMKFVFPRESCASYQRLLLIVSAKIASLDCDRITRL